MIVSIRLRPATVQICLSHLLADYRVLRARHVQQACDWLFRGDVDLIMASSALPFWDVQVLERTARQYGIDVLFLDERHWPENLSVWIDHALARRDRYRQRAEHRSV